MLDNETAVQSLISYLEDSEEPNVHWSKEEWEESSIRRWTAEELMTALMDHPCSTVSEVLDAFWIKMLYFSARAKGCAAEKIFSIAAQFTLKYSEYLHENDI